MEFEDKRVVLLFSGGIDSTVLLYKLLSDGYSVYPLYIDYGQKTSCGEKTAITSILRDCNMTQRLLQLNISDVARIGAGTLIGGYPKKTIKLEDWYKQEFFPNRNIMLLTFGAMYCYKLSGKYVSIGVTGMQSYADTSQEFINNVNCLFSHTLGEIEIIAPYAGKSRYALLDDGIRLQAPFTKTFSCNVIGTHHCQFCTSCNDRGIALKYVYNR